MLIFCRLNLPAKPLCYLVLAVLAGSANAQNSAQESTQQDTTVSYPADYFRQWNPVTVSDMIDRIPGIAIALDDSGGGGGGNNRGLGNSENILINGRRLSGKDNDANAQLDRIPFDQVSHIEIIRGTSNQLVGVRNEGQIINIVTTSNNEIAFTASSAVNRYQDGNMEPAASLIVNGSSNNLDYRVTLEQQPNYEVVDIIEESVFGVGNFGPNDLRQLQQITDQTDRSIISAISYRLTPRQTLSVNGQYRESDPPWTVDRVILNYGFSPPAVFREQEDNPSTRSSWELGADYDWQFADNSRLQLLSINNQQDQDSVRQRFQVGADGVRQKDLVIDNRTVNTERIYRAVYTRPVAEGHNLEFGVERAQTILDTQLALARLNSAGELVDVPLPNTNSRIEELRYEGFVVHFWQLNSRMRLETQLLYEVSEISQSGDVSKSRDFDFIRPKLDYRFDITPTLQLQLSVEKAVDQLSFADFAASADPRDEDRDTVAGNPELRQQQSWRYNVNLEYRFLESRGVVNARAWYWDVTDAIGRVDATLPGQPLVSAAGNIGDAEVSAVQLNSSFRVTPNFLVSGSLLARASEVIDPFSGAERRLVPNDRGFYTVGVRHDLPAMNMNYGVDYRGADQGNRPLFDINRIDHFDSIENLSLFIERNSIGPLGLVARFEVENALDRGMCLDRFRFSDRLSVGVISEVERRCNERGTRYMLQLRGTF
jgi:outer membrane receptor for ferrienterochelin and colicin